VTDHATRRDTAVQNTLAAIDAATTPTCSTCATELSPDAPSPWWCSEACAVSWLRMTVPPLPGTDDQEETGLSRRIVCCGPPDRMDIWLQWGDGPDQRAELADWLAANNLPVNDIPVDSTIYVEGGQITVDVYQRHPTGGVPVDLAGHPYLDTITVPLVQEWPARRGADLGVSTADARLSWTCIPTSSPETAPGPRSRPHPARSGSGWKTPSTSSSPPGSATSSPSCPASAASDPGGHDELGTENHRGHARARLLATDTGTVLQNPVAVRGGL
jgi:hypothetical protein